MRSPSAPSLVCSVKFGAYGILSERGFAKRWTYFINPEGVIARVDREVEARTAGADLVEHLEALGVPPAED